MSAVFDGVEIYANSRKKPDLTDGGDIMSNEVKLEVKYTDPRYSELPDANLRFEITGHNHVISDFEKIITEALSKMKYEPS